MGGELDRRLLDSFIEIDYHWLFYSKNMGNPKYDCLGNILIILNESIKCIYIYLRSTHYLRCL
jgi:hypothetical protein